MSSHQHGYGSASVTENTQLEWMLLCSKRFSHSWLSCLNDDQQNPGRRPQQKNRLPALIQSQDSQSLIYYTDTMKNIIQRTL